MKKVLLADDHEVTRRGVREILQDHFPGICVDEAQDAKQLGEWLAKGPWELIVLDVMMPGATVLDNLAQIRSRDAAVPVLVLTGVTEIEVVLETLQAGANGFIHKHRASEDLVEAIRQVSRGGTYLHTDTAVAVAAALRGGSSGPLHRQLSRRELEVFRRIALGESTRAIASQLNLSEKTVATYLSRIREKTGLNSPVEIARYALQKGLVE